MAGILRTLLLRLILENAIIFEEKAYWFYESALKKAKHAETKELLKSLQAEELKHRLRLEEAQQRGDLRLCCDSEPELENSVEALTEDWPEISPESGREEILKTALLKEKQARDFYQSMAERFKNEFITDIFHSLANEEKKHLQRVSSMME